MGATAVCALLRRGAHVVVGDLLEESFGNNLVNHLKNDGNNGLLSDNKIQFCRVDVTQPETITAALDVVQDVFGIPVNAVVNSAGIATASKTVNKKGQTSTKAMDEFIRMMEINTIGSFHVARLAAERMAAMPLGQPPSSDADGDDDSIRATVDASSSSSLCGCIIQMASIAAYEGQIGKVVYTASKAAIVGMTLPMAQDLAPWGIHVVTIVRPAGDDL